MAVQTARGPGLLRLEVEIAPADLCPGDLGDVLALHARVYVLERGYPPSFEVYVLQALAEFMADFRPGVDLFLAARSDAKLMGSVAVKRLNPAAVQLRFLIVERELRGFGAGQSLFRAAVDHARRTGCRELTLETASDLEAARAIYERNGLRRLTSTAAPWLPKGVMSEVWAGPLPA